MDYVISFEGGRIGSAGTLGDGNCSLGVEVGVLELLIDTGTWVRFSNTRCLPKGSDSRGIRMAWSRLNACRSDTIQVVFRAA